MHQANSSKKQRMSQNKEPLHMEATASPLPQIGALRPIQTDLQPTSTATELNELLPTPVSAPQVTPSPAGIPTPSYSTELTLPPPPFHDETISNALPLDGVRNMSILSSSSSRLESSSERPDTAAQTSVRTGNHPAASSVVLQAGLQHGRLVRMHVFAWGRGDLGQLGTGQEVTVLSPQLLETLEGKAIPSIAANIYNSAFVTVEGELYMTGANDNLQLGTKGVVGNTLLPRRVAALDAHKVTHAALGASHVVVITEDTSALFAWGSADFGQLGSGTVSTDVPLPKAVKFRGESRWCAVSCGADFSLGLRGNGEVYAWGQGNAGQLGTGDTSGSTLVPTLVPRLWPVGVTQVSCGDQFSGALCVDGRVFMWGRNKYGQLGLGDLNNALLPTQVELNGATGRQLSCGGDHVLLLVDGGTVYSWGQGTWGQLGHGSTDNVLYPRKVDMVGCGSVVQVSAGNRHSLALCDDGSVMSWGCGEDGQLGTGDTGNQLLPTSIGLSSSMGHVQYVVAGGDHSFAMVRAAAEGGVCAPDPVQDEQYGRALRPVQPPQLAALARQAQAEPTNKHLTHSLRRAIHDVFHSPAFLRHAFSAAPQCAHLGSHGRQGDVPSGSQRAGSPKATMMMDVDGEERQAQEEKQQDVCKGDQGALPSHGLDVHLIHNTYNTLLKLYNTEILAAMATAASELLDGMVRALQHGSGISQADLLPALFILLQCPLLGESHGTGSQLVTKLSQVFMRLTTESHRVMESWISTLPPEILAGRVVRPVQRYITLMARHYRSGAARENVLAAGKLLGHVFRGNERSGKPIIAVSEFYNKEISEGSNLQEEYLRFLQLLDSYQAPHAVPLVTLCQLPFLLTPSAKSSILHLEAALQKHKELQTNQIQALMVGFSPGLVAAVGWLDIRVRREHVLEDALNQILARPQDLKKPLRVTFSSAGVAEEAVDEGGVTKEFFQLLTRELLNENFGMFVYNDNTRTFWFNQLSIEGADEFQLVGVVLGLAIYNGVLLDMHFPLVVYKKLLGLKASFQDLVDAFPEVGKGLQQLLDYEGDVESTFVLTFSVEYDYFGEMRTHDLKLGGAHIAVTNDNRQEYVDLITQWRLALSIQRQFEAFRKGFYSVCGGPALTLFRYNELELLVCGLPHLNFDDLQRAARYDGGYSAEHQSIKDFWSILHEFSLDQKKKFLLFTTGSDRAPVGGLSQLPLLIQRGGPDSNRLPSSHTCFNALLLPEYISKEKMKRMLQLAIDNAQGFGLQ